MNAAALMFALAITPGAQQDLPLPLPSVIKLSEQAAPITKNRQVAPVGSPAAWFSVDDYPAEAIETGAEGRVVIMLAIDSTGRPSACSVSVPSGSTVLDTGTCAVAMRNGHFVPATDRKGRPTAATFELPVRWVLPSTKVMEATQIPLRVAVATEIYVNAEGMVTMCKVVERAGLPPQVDPCSRTQAGSDTTVLQKDGRPVSYRIVRRMESQTTLGD